MNYCSKYIKYVSKTTKIDIIITNGQKRRRHIDRRFAVDFHRGFINIVEFRTQTQTYSALRHRYFHNSHSERQWWSCVVASALASMCSGLGPFIADGVTVHPTVIQ